MTQEAAVPTIESLSLESLSPLASHQMHGICGLIKHVLGPQFRYKVNHHPRQRNLTVFSVLAIAHAQRLLEMFHRRCLAAVSGRQQLRFCTYRCCLLRLFKPLLSMHKQGNLLSQFSLGSVGDISRLWGTSLCFLKSINFLCWQKG